MKQPDGLLMVLLDPTANVGDRDDAAMDLSAFDDPRIESALMKVACSDVDDLVVASCGESLGEIWCRRGHFPEESLRALPAVARIEAAAFLQSKWPERFTLEE